MSVTFIGIHAPPGAGRGACHDLDPHVCPAHLVPDRGRHGRVQQHHHQQRARGLGAFDDLHDHDHRRRGLAFDDLDDLDDHHDHHDGGGGSGGAGGTGGASTTTTATGTGGSGGA